MTANPDNNNPENDALSPTDATPEHESNEGQTDAPEGQNTNSQNQSQGESFEQTLEAVSDSGAEPQSESEGTMDYPKVIETLRSELDQSKDQMMRALAEAENARRRAQKDREDASKFAVSNFAKDLLSVADNLRRGLEAVPDDLKEDVRLKNLTDGIEATERELLRAFDKNGIEKITPEKGQNFDPNFHEVMFEAPVPGTPAGAIIEVIEVGYVLNGRILRPARVGVAKDDGSGNAAPSGNGDPGGQIDTQA